jgi:hypothetical protein
MNLDSIPELEIVHVQFLRGIFSKEKLASVIIIYFCCLYELLFTSIWKLSKISDFIFHYMYFHYNIVHKYFTFIIVFIWGPFFHFQFSQNIFA